MTSRRLTLLILLSLISFNLWSQRIYRFSKRIDKYPSELSEYMAYNLDKSKKKELKYFISSFESFWMSDTLNEKQKKAIISYSTMMASKRMRAYPFFESYLKTVRTVAATKEGLLKFDAWHQSLKPLLRGKSTTKYLRYLNFSSQLFKNKYAYVSPAVIWEIGDLNFTIENTDKGPRYRFKSTRLSCYTRRDTSYIFTTQGLLDPITGRWYGKGGRVDWRRAHLDTNMVYAELKNYEIKLKSPKYFADSVSFYDQRRFGFALLGRLSEKALSSPPKTANFPQFSSYRTDLEISEVFKDIDYYGGYSLNGAKVIGSGTQEHKAYFIFKRKGKKLVWAGAESFLILPDRINSKRVNVIIYLDNDSIYHPGLSLSYLNAKRFLTLYRMDKGLSMAPFYDSYHKLDIYTEAMFWKLDEDYIDMKMISEEGATSKAYFESLNYFSEQRYDRLTGIDRLNPVYSVYQYIKKEGFNEFYVQDYAAFVHMSLPTVKALLMKLATQGFLIYDINDDYCIAKDRVYTYVKAHQKRVDYDVIQFQSTVQSIPNASLNLLNNDLVIQGVRTVFLSDSQKVYIFPKNKRVVVKKNRDFEFDGKIKAGRFDLYAHQCSFSYDKFKLDLPHIDSLSFKVKSFEPDQYGEYRQKKIKTVIEDLKGDILVDDPNNKSGIKHFPEYPILNSKTHSFVYYNRHNTFNGIYTRDKFYYRLESFTIDSLDNFQTEGLEFKGYLASAGIFPDIDEPLKVQHDYSLGFQTETGPAGLAIYGGKGRYLNKIMLSNKGLRGDGELHYLTSISRSEDFMFFPDSTNGMLSSYVLQERKTGVEYPPAIAQGVWMHWEPYSNLMTINTVKEEQPLSMYDSEASLLGTLFLSPDFLSGRGQISIKDAEMDANYYKFKNQYYNTDTCDFRLKKFQDESMGLGDAGDENEDAYSTSNFKARIDFKERKGEFEANGGQKRVDFPENLYYCFMDQFVWYMDKDETEFSSTAKQVDGFDQMSEKEKIDVDIQGSEFISIHPDQDSLRFVAQRAIFNRRKALIHAYGVENIRVADAAIIPDKKELKIYRKAEIDELKNAIIWANATTKYHRLYNGTVMIEGRHKYHGRALFDYKDETGQVNNIYFTNLYVDTTGTSIGEGKIQQDAQFTLSPAFDFYGTSRMIAYEKFIWFDGYTRLHQSCDTLSPEWISFKTFIDPNNVMIPIGEELHNDRNNPLFTGIYQNLRGSDIFGSFFQPIAKSNRNPIVSAHGALIYDKVSQEYRISNPDKLKQLSLSDNYVSLSKMNCSLSGEGKIYLALHPGPVSMTAYGSARYFMKQDSAMAYVSLPLDFYFNEKALNKMAEDLNNRMDADAVNLDNKVFHLMLGQIFGEEKKEKYVSEIDIQGGAFKKVPKPLQISLLISDVKLKYNPRTHSFVSEGSIGIASIGKTQIIKYFDGIIELKNKGQNTALNIALDLGDKDYYFFSYNSTTGQMLAISSNEEFNKIIEETKADDRKMKAKEEGKTLKYAYNLSTAVSYKKFVRKMKIYR